MGFSDIFKSQARLEAEAKQRAHEYRAEHGMKVTKSRGSYTPEMQVRDQQRIEETKGGHAGRRTGRSGRRG